MKVFEQTKMMHACNNIRPMIGGRLCSFQGRKVRLQRDGKIIKKRLYIATAETDQLTFVALGQGFCCRDGINHIWDIEISKNI